MFLEKIILAVILCGTIFLEEIFLGGFFLEKVFGRNKFFAKFDKKF